jgi:hypothetical protein
VAAGSFAQDVRMFTRTVEARARDAFVGIATAVHESVQIGSALTGAPGQPVDTGRLRASWQLLFETPTRALIATNVVYAPPIEDGVGQYGPLTLRSQVGGWHSVALTIAGFQKIVDAEVRKAAAGASGEETSATAPTGEEGG